jgi:hypothetical protein
MDRPAIGEAARQRYDTISSKLAVEAGANPGHMMGMPTLYLGGKAFAGLWGDAMIFKLAGAEHAAALSLPGARLFDPSGVGRAMKAWVQVPLDQSAEWPRLAQQAAGSLQGEQA